MTTLIMLLADRLGQFPRERTTHRTYCLASLVMGLGGIIVAGIFGYQVEGLAQAPFLFLLLLDAAWVMGSFWGLTTPQNDWCRWLSFEEIERLQQRR
ncbi:MAG TPA: hypothetical protein VNG90_02415 [Candidatus Acidoferrum sp.]|nr:hypothetical protein [Candidatus Acidoferrum sp.]